MSSIDLEKGSQLDVPSPSIYKSEQNASVTVIEGDNHSVFIESRPSSPSTVAHAADTPDDIYPDGGFQAWLTVLGSFLALLCTFGQLVSIGTFQSWYADNQLQHLPPSTIAWIGSLQLWVFFFSGGFIGCAFDAWGPRVLMITGSGILVLSIMVTSFCTQFWQYLLFQGVLFGLGVGLLFYPSLSAISTHFHKYRATALGIAMAGSGIGGVIFPIMFRRLFEICGFAWGVRISGFISLALASIACCTVSSRLVLSKQSGTRKLFDFSHLTDRTFILLVLGSIFVALGLFIPNFYIVDYATSQGLSPSLSFTVLAVLNGGGIVGRIAPSYLSDAIGRFNLMAPCVFIAGVVSLAFWPFAKTTATIMVYAILYGFFSGAFNALIVPCIAQISPIREIGVRIGMLYTIISFPSLASGPAGGAMLKLSHGSWMELGAFSGATIIVGSLFFIWSRMTIDRRILARV